MLIAPAAAFSGLSAKCCSTSVGAGKNETIQRFEKGAGSFGQDPTGLSYVTSVFLICEAAGEKCEKMRVFRHQRLVTLSCTTPPPSQQERKKYLRQRDNGLNLRQGLFWL